jgi:membrane associated rhomboid family serine protease
LRSTQRIGIGQFGYRFTPWVKRLIIANTVVFLLMWSRLVPLEWQSAHLGFRGSEALKEPWTIITYMFVHANFLHVFINMLMLFFFGPPLEERWGGKEFIKYYMICGVGAALFNLVTLALGSDLPIVGASGAIFGVMLAYALNWPDSLIWIYAIFPIKAKYLVLILGAISFFSAFSGSSDGIAHFAHLGGLIVGFVYLKQGWRVGAWFGDKRKRFRRRKLSVVPGGSGPGGTPKRSKEAEEEEKILKVVDAILEKIAAHGLESLTREERRFLDEVSRRRQTGQGIRH